MLNLRYDTEPAREMARKISEVMRDSAYEASSELARERGAFPLFNADLYLSGQSFASRLPQSVKDKIRSNGLRNSHLLSIAPTGTISLAFADNASNGIEPSFAHHYFRNVIREGRKTKEKVDVFSFELLAYRELINSDAMPGSMEAGKKLPDYFTTADDVTPAQHVDIQAAAQKWVDSSISKTANVPTDYKYEDFKHIYLYAHEKGLKGCTTFRFNPEAFQGVLVKEEDLKNTKYVFTLDDGSEVEVSGDQEIEYDGEMHSAANLFDALKEGYYGKYQTSVSEDGK
jgi:ribonucleoside-diphosphate reductase alpha chain